PLDYYNRPSFLKSGPDQMVVAQGGGGWNFLPLNRWGDRSLTRSILSADRVPHLESAVMSRFLPRFKTSEVRLRPELVRDTLKESGSANPQVVPPRMRAADPKIPFRVSERREANVLQGAARRPAVALRPGNPSATATPEILPGRPRTVPGT